MAREDREVVVVERGDGSLKWLLVGAAFGAGLALLFAPRTGKDFRRELGRGIRRMRDLADDTVQEFKRDVARDEESELRSMSDPAAYEEEEVDEEPVRPPRPSLVSAREELERRLAAARARRQPASSEEEEPVA